MPDKINVLWGTGQRADNFMSCFPVGNIEFFIDNDIKKFDKIFWGKKVYHPSAIKEWNNLFIIIASGYYKEIREQLQGIGLKENEDFVYYMKCINNQQHMDRLVDELKQNIKDFKAHWAQYRGRNLFFGSNISFDKNSNKLLNLIEKYGSENRKILYMSETNSIIEKEKRGLVKFPYFRMPTLLLQNYYLAKESIFSGLKIRNDVRTFAEKKDYIQQAVIGFKKKNTDIENGFAELFAFYAYMFVDEALKFIQPKNVIVWNAFYPFHVIVKGICKERGIDLIFVEYGVLPGTYVVEKLGQMGESWPARFSAEFQKLEVCKDDIKQAVETCSFLNRTGLNRKEQPENGELIHIKKQLPKGRPNIVYYGQNDYESGMYPYVKESKAYHSPCFQTSDDALQVIAGLGKCRGWNVIYKPHPLCMQNLNNCPDNVFVIKKCNINDLVDFADVNVTILSTVAYVSLLREKPVVMLGYTQLKGKCCTYEAFEQAEIEKNIEKAIEEGYTVSQRCAFIYHVARLLRYYLLDDLGERELRFGMKWRNIIKGGKIQF